MKPIDVSEILNIAEYELERPELRPKMMALKDRRRVLVGGHLTFLFENRETVRYQIQEMVRIERMVFPEAIRHEVETYNELIPGPGDLSACLLIEYESPRERDVRLRELRGFEEHVWIAVADLPSTRARFDTRQISTDRLSSVQYIKFPLTPEQRVRWTSGARIVIDHPSFRAEQPLTGAQLAELGGDFA
ncbi:MAG: DUF3501 family protein [Bryobacteraceae bacterium]